MVRSARPRQHRAGRSRLGGALAFDWAARHPGEPERSPSSRRSSGRSPGTTFRDRRARASSRYPRPGVGETKVLDENFFIEFAIRATVLRDLSDEEHDVYRDALSESGQQAPAASSGRAPFRSRASRRTSSPESRRTTAGLPATTTCPSCCSPSKADRTNPARGTGVDRLVRSQHRQPRGQELRASSPPRPRGPTRGHRRGDRRVG